MGQYFGFDASKYQGAIKWDNIPSSYSFCILRAGYGITKAQKDPKFDEYVNGAKKRGLHIGAYWFLYACNVSEAIQNAKAFLQVLEPYKGVIDFPVYLDIEGDSVSYMRGRGYEPTKTLISEMIRAFCTELEDAGYYVGVYSDNNFINHWFTSDILTSFDLWFAYWVNAFSPSYCIRKCGIWQHTNKGNITGIDGNVDLDYTEREYYQIIKNKGLNHLTPDVEKEVEKVENVKRYTVEETEDEIIIRVKK